MSDTTFDDLNRDCVEQVLGFACDFPGWKFRPFFGWCKQVAVAVYDFFESRHGLIKYQNGVLMWMQGRNPDTFLIYIRNTSEVTSKSLCLETLVTITAAGCLQTKITATMGKTSVLFTCNFSEECTAPEKWPKKGNMTFINHSIYENYCYCNWCEQSKSKKFQRFLKNASEDRTYINPDNILKSYKHICDI
jgi:hypothetical protein